MMIYPNWYLHVVVSVEGFAAHGAGELGGADQDLGRCGDPVLPLRSCHVARVYG